MAWTRLLYSAAVAFSVHEALSSTLLRRSPSLRSTKSQAVDLSSGARDTSSSFLLESAAPRSHIPPACSASLVEETPLDGAGKTNFDTETGIVMLDNDTVIVISDRAGGMATWGIPSEGLVQSDPFAFLSAPSNISPNSLVANRATNQLHVFGSWNGTTQLFLLMYDEMTGQPFGRAYVSTVTLTDGDGDVVRAETSSRDVIACTTQTGAVYRIAYREDGPTHQ